MADKLSLENLLSDLEAESTKKTTKSWSLDEIDSLLGIGGSEPQDETPAPQTFADFADVEEEEPEDPYIEEEEYDEPELPEVEVEADDATEQFEDFDDDEFVEEPAPKKKAKEKKEKRSFFQRMKAVLVDGEQDDEEEDEEYEEYDESEFEVASDDSNVEIEEEAEVEEPVAEEPKPQGTALSRTTQLLNEVEIEAKNSVMELADDEDIEEVEVPSKEEAVEPETEEQIRERRALAQKTIGIYPIRNEKINHQIVTDADRVEKSPEGVIQSDKYRERFLNVPKQHLERTADYEALHMGENQDPIERDGRIVKRSKFVNTADLESVPTIISADAELSSVEKTIVAADPASPVIEREEDEVAGQIKLTGFGEEEEIDQIDEENAEETLREKRAAKITNFKLDTDFSDEEEDEEEEVEEKKFKAPVSAQALVSNFIEDEYEEEADEERIRAELASTTKTTLITGIVQAVITVIALVLTGIIARSNGSVDIVGGAFGCGIVNIILLAIAGACGASTLVRGFKGLVAKKPNAASGTFVVVAACLLEDIAIMLFTRDGYTTAAIYTAAACFTLFLANVAKYIALLRAKNNFAFITSGTQLYSTEKISGEDDAFEIGRGLLIGDPEIYYNARMDRPSYFIENSFEDDPADEYADKIILGSLAAGLLFALIFGIIHGSLVFAFGTIAAVCCITIPGFMLIASNIALLFENREFNKNGAAIVGHRAVEDSTDANAYVFDATDIFKKGSCSIIGIKTFHNMRIDDAILYAAALVIESDGPLADIFDNVILGKKDLLPPVESLAYEERLGLSSWIHGRRVLLGTRDLLINHNVEAPDRDFEAQYTHDGRKVIYLAIAGKISAMFVIKYQPDKRVGKYLRKLDRAGVAILVRSCDCNITEEMVCEYFGLPLSAVKILSPVSGDIFQRYREEDIETAPAGIIHNGTLESSITAFYEARELQGDVYANKLVSYIYSGFALLLFLVLTIVTGREGLGISGGQIVLFQFLFGLIASAIPVIKRRIDK